MKLGGNRPPGDNPLLFSISGTGSFICPVTKKEKKEREDRGGGKKEFMNALSCVGIFTHYRPINVVVMESFRIRDNQNFKKSVDTYKE